MSYNEFDSCFYTISNTAQPGGLDGIARIDQNGVWTDLGPITVAGNTVYFMESVTHNPFNGLIYVTASLNGNQPSDYWSETLLVVDLGTMTGTIAGTFQHTGAFYEPECDIITFGPNNKMYYNDTEPGGPQFKYVFEQDLDFLTPAVLLHSEYSTPGYTNGMSYRDEKVYFTVERDLRVIDLVSGIHTNLGTMYSASDFNGNVLSGLTWIGRKGEIHGEPTSVSENLQIELKAFPNPSSGIINLVVSEGAVENIQVLNSLGQVVHSIQTIAYPIILDLSIHPAGFYVVKVSTDLGVIERRIVLE